MSRTYIVYKVSSPFSDPIALHNPLEPLLSYAMSTSILLVHIAKRGWDVSRSALVIGKMKKATMQKQALIG